MRIRNIMAAASLAAFAFTAAPATAATPVQQAEGQALILVPLSLTKIQDLDFGSIVPSPLSGAVVINATTGARTMIGGVTGVPSDAGFRARFAGAGSPNQQVIITMNPPVQLDDGVGNNLPVLGLTMDGPAIRTIDPVTRAFFLGVGGTIMIAANQAEGVYVGQFDVTANYQ